MIHLVVRLFQHVGRNRRYQFLALFCLMLVSAFAEVVSLGTMLPFLGALTAPEKVLNYPRIGGIAKAWGVTSTDNLVLAFTVLFAIAALVAGGLRLLLLWATNTLAFTAGADLSAEVYHRTLHQPYRVHVTRNSSEVIAGITQKVTIAISILLSLLFTLSSSALLLAIMLSLLAIDAVVATVAAVSFGIGYSLITWLSRSKLEYNSQRIAEEHSRVVKALQEGLGGIRDVILDGTESVFCEIYRRSSYPLLRAQSNNSFLSQSPRYAMEALGMVLIASLAYLLSSQPGGVNTALPVLGTLALGAQRLLPVLQQLYVNWANLAGNRASLANVIEFLEQPFPDDYLLPIPAPLAFRHSIRFNDVYFRYSDDGPWVLNGFDLTIPKGERIGIIGSTGGGKSTLLDLLMFLLEPTQGGIFVDGKLIDSNCRRAWQQVIAHVPQSIYLADTTLAENIAFGVPPEQIDMELVRQAARQAQIAEFIESQPMGYNGVVGERGIRLSGGQRQRIGIARALYRQATVLVFDEATSALDTATEQAVIEAIESLNPNLTVFMVAHRLTTVRKCDLIVRLEHGRVVSQGSYDDLIGATASGEKLPQVSA